MWPWDGFWSSGFWLFPALMMILCLLFMLPFRRSFFGGGCSPNHGEQNRQDGPLEVAKRRYAAGEISKEEFEEIKRTIV